MPSAMDFEEIRQVIYRLARGLDRLDADLLRSCFHEDGTDDHGLFTGSATDFVDWVIPVLQTMQATQHTIHNILFDWKSNDKAATESYFVAYHAIQQEGAPFDMIAAGRYLDTFVRKGGEWRIQHRQAVYDWNRVDPSTDTWHHKPASDVLMRGERGTDDPSYRFVFGAS